MASAPAPSPLELDSRAWEQCVSLLHGELNRIASREDCQDAVQEALTEGTAQLDLSVENVTGWVLVIARRRLLDAHRAQHGRGKRRRHFVHAEADDLAEERVSESELVELLEDGARQDASEAMARLSAEHQRLLTLAIERTRYPEVGQILGISSKAAKERTLRAWNALRQAFIDSELGPDCSDARRLMVRPRARGGAGTSERLSLVAHIETCAPCRAYEKRLKGLIATSPAPTLPFWQQLLLRLEQFLVGAPGPRTIETAAASALTNGGTQTLARMVAVLCAGATVAGVCASALRPSHPDPIQPQATAPRLTPTPTIARATPSPTATPRATPVRTPKPQNRATNKRAGDEPTGDVKQDTRSITRSRPAAAPSGSTSTSEFAPSGGGSNANTAAAPASGAGGGEFRP